MFKHASIISRCVQDVQKINVRFLSFRSIIKLFSIYFQTPCNSGKPPYKHICQIGDPVLRTKAEPVDTKVIQTEEFQKTLEHLQNVMRKYDTVGLAAPQIGFPWQVFAIEVTEKSLKEIHPYVREFCKMEACPLTYFINPRMQIMDSKEITLYEMCGSIHNFHAEVPRATEIEIKALNRFGESFSWRAKHWLARIAQHEMDHINGIMYTDRMFPLTFEFLHWENMNENDGKVVVK